MARFVAHYQLASRKRCTEQSSALLLCTVVAVDSCPYQPDTHQVMIVYGVYVRVYEPFSTTSYAMI